MRNRTSLLGRQCAEFSEANQFGQVREHEFVNWSFVNALLAIA